MANYWYQESQKNLTGNMMQGEKYQQITYFKFDRINGINVDDKFIDFSNAVKEMKSLSVLREMGTSFIGFTNMRTRELIQFLRLDEDLWLADVPINPGAGWDGYAWVCVGDMESILSTVDMFFEEVSWFETLPFTMRRHKKRRS